MPVFFLSPELITPPEVTISGELLTHIRDSLRIAVGDPLLIGDGRGKRYRTQVTAVAKQAITSRILDVLTEPSSNAPALILGQALLKGDKMDWVMQKAAELGVQEIIPLHSQHCVVQPRQDRIDSQRARWQKIVLEAAQQSEQWQIATVSPPVALSAYLAQPPAPVTRLMLTERREQASNLTNVALLMSPDAAITLLVGPEGGWAREELAMAESHGWIPITLGATVLRAETAALAALAVLQHRIGRLG